MSYRISMATPLACALTANACTNEADTRPANARDAVEDVVDTDHQDVMYDTGSDTRDDLPSDTDGPSDSSDTRPNDTESQTDASDTGDTCTPGADCDSDGLADCEEALLGTEICTFDTDGDGRSDFEEVSSRTDPLDPDTDNHGLTDGREIDLKLDPTDKETFDDGIVDSQRWFIQACDDPRPEIADIYDNRYGNWRMALPAAVSGLTRPGTTTHSRFRVYVSATLRNYTDGTQQVINRVSLAPQSRFASNPRVHQRLTQMTSVSGLTTSSARERIECVVLPPRARRDAEMYWVIDPSTSMQAKITELQNHSAALFDTLDNAAVDYRVGVTTMDVTNSGRLIMPEAWHTDAASFETALDQILTSNAPHGDDDGFEAALDGLDFMTWQTSSQPDPDEGIRRGANIMTIFFGDEEAQTFQDDPIGSIPQVYNNFVSRLKSFGTAISIVPRDIPSYRLAALETSGAYSQLSQTATEEQLQDIAAKFVAKNSRYHFGHRPISSTIRVYLDDAWVPASLPDGDGHGYDVENNTLNFYGSYRPRATPGSDGSGYVVVTYERFTPWSP